MPATGVELAPAYREIAPWRMAFTFVPRQWGIAATPSGSQRVDATTTGPEKSGELNQPFVCAWRACRCPVTNSAIKRQIWLLQYRPPKRFMSS